MRGDALADFLRFLGVRGNNPPGRRGDVLAAHGARLHRSTDLSRTTRFSAWAGSAPPGPRSSSPTSATRARAFRTSSSSRSRRKDREWGVQNLYIQMLADAGVIGLVLLLAVGATGLLLAWRAAARAPTPWAAGARSPRHLRATHARRGVGVTRNRGRASRCRPLAACCSGWPLRERRPRRTPMADPSSSLPRAAPGRRLG